MSPIFYPISALVNLITSSILAILVISRNNKSPLNITFFCFASSVAFWSLFYFLWQATNNRDIALRWCRWLMVGAIFIPSTFFHFSIELINSFQKYYRLILLNYFISIIFIIFNLTNLLVKDVVSRLGFVYWPIAGEAYLLYLIFFLGVVLYAHILMFKRYKSLSGIKKIQTRYVFLGTTIGFLGGVTNYPLWFNIEILPVGNILVSVYVFLVAIAIIKYRLMDIKVVLTRATIFIFVYSLVLGLPIWIGLRYFGVGKWLLPTILMGFFATIGPFLYLYIQKRAEDRLLQEQRSYQATLRQASAGMGRIKDLEKLLNMIVYVLTRTIRLEHSVIYVYDEVKKEFRLGAFKHRRSSVNFLKKIPESSSLIVYLNKNHAPVIFEEIKQRAQDYHDNQLLSVENAMNGIESTLVVPIYIEKRLTAFVGMGKKESGKSYTEDDLGVFSILANQAALAIENAKFYEDMKVTQQQLFQAEKMATIGTMADGLSHQINNRFHALGFIAGDALDTIKLNKNIEMSDKIKEIIGDLERAFVRVQENVVQGGEVVQGLLKYTRKGEEGFLPVDVDAVVSSAYEMVQFKIKNYQMSLVRNYDKDLLPRVKGNSTQLQEVFFNLIDNGYDAMMQRKNELKDPNYHAILTINVEIQGDHLLMIFEDNGMGVKEEDVQKLFTPFFTTKLSSKKGTGLGLYVIRKIIEENHKGKVEFESKYMIGTQMKILLPIAI